MSNPPTRKNTRLAAIAIKRFLIFRSIIIILLVLAYRSRFWVNDVHDGQQNKQPRVREDMGSL
jgi:hypothetical protein